MKAPGKLYLRKRNKLPLEVVPEKWYEKDPQRLYGSVEYTRTDAFIEKACDAYCRVCKMPNCRRNECKMIDEFRAYMKGE